MSIWTVDTYCDRIREREDAAREKEFSVFQTRNFHVFDSERDAVLFVIERAEMEIRKAKGEIKKTEVRLKKHQARLANFPQSNKNDAASPGVGVSEEADTV